MMSRNTAFCIQLDHQYSENYYFSFRTKQELLTVIKFICVYIVSFYAIIEIGTHSYRWRFTQSIQNATKKVMFLYKNIVLVGCGNGYLPRMLNTIITNTVSDLMSARGAL